MFLSRGDYILGPLQLGVDGEAVIELDPVVHGLVVGAGV
jgi:hypothetical protein